MPPQVCWCGRSSGSARRATSARFTLDLAICPRRPEKPPCPSAFGAKGASHPSYPRLVRTLLSLSVALALCGACGPKLPPRYVLEKDLEGYKFRRYQQVLDVELAFDGNPAVGHTATYVRGGKTVHVAPVFITVYQRGSGLAESVRQRLRDMTGYTFDITKMHGAYVYRMRGDSKDSWLIWLSGRQLVKLGAPDGESEVPEALLEAYLDAYPSDLDGAGKAKAGAESAGRAPEENGDAGAP